MWTRNLTIVISNNNIKVAKYCQWDGYLEGHGKSILKFLKEIDLKILKQKVDKLKFITDDELNATYISVGSNPDDQYISYDLHKKYSEMYKHLSRDIGSEILDIIYNSNKVIKTINDYEFAKESLFCEYCYVIDLDKNTFEVFKGFNRIPLDEGDRFYHLQNSSSEYKPVKILKSFDLNNLPTEEEFLLLKNNFN